ncbi:hypothetical protein IQ07DRAFT_584634 [Pyrenochaeta sp. DS3sAY3a]|nr:hypothetical protein IQ07DRAFT_584634 [Pyrenochaeta sp. DS3sAY3a]
MLSQPTISKGTQPDQIRNHTWLHECVVSVDILVINMMPTINGCGKEYLPLALECYIGLTTGWSLLYEQEWTCKHI